MSWWRIAFVSIAVIACRCAAFSTKFVVVLHDLADSMEPLWETHGRRLSEAGVRRGSGRFARSLFKH